MIDLFTWRVVKAWHVLCAALELRALPRDAKAPTLIDIGARGGIQTKWQMLARMAKLELHLVEPEPVEAARLRKAYPQVRVHQVALGESDGEAEFHANQDPGLSSLLQPEHQVVASSTRAQPVSVRRLDSLCRDGSITPDFAKLDIQGFELLALRGFGEMLDRVCGIELEAQFAPLYRGQSLFNEIYDWLTARGFILVAMRPQGLIDGGIIEANFFFQRGAAPTDARSRVLTRVWRRLNRIPTHRNYVLQSD